MECMNTSCKNLPRAPRDIGAGARLVAAAMAVAMFATTTYAGGCGVDGTVIRDAAVSGQTAADTVVNSSASDIMSAAEARSSCLDRFGVQSIASSGGGIISSLANKGMESACNQARGAAGRYLNQAQTSVTNAVPSAAGVALPSIGYSGVGSSALNSAVGNVNSQVQGAVQSQVAQAQAAPKSTWDRMTCWVTGC